VTATTTATAPPDVNEMRVVHRAFRREFGLVPGLVRAVAEGDTRRAAVVAAHLRFALAGLHMHHTGEDEYLWPLLLERAAPRRELIETMQAQHERVDAYAAQTAALLDVWESNASSVGGEQLARLVESFTEALVEHLDLEEREILPLCAEHMTAEEWNRLGEHGREHMSPRQLPLLFGAALEEADDRERAAMLAALPAPVRVLVRTLGAWQYRRYVRRVRGA
jgi:iron-sulfur cluster repair protein YtfE (RIC family)